MVFGSFYVATLLVIGWLPILAGQWAWLAASVVATSAALVIWEGGRWDLGLYLPPRRILAEVSAGGAFGSGLILACAGAIVLTSEQRHLPGAGFPIVEVLAVYLPAVLHEELVFRGYPLQKLLRWNRPAAILLLAFVFAALHARNTAVTPLALANIFLGGVLLGLARDRTRNLWFPIGLHFAWNVVAGPLLGHEVSGHRPLTSVLAEAGAGPEWLTGGAFGIEGSVWMTVVECAGIAAMLAGNRSQSPGSGVTPPIPDGTATGKRERE